MQLVRLSKPRSDEKYSLISYFFADNRSRSEYARRSQLLCECAIGQIEHKIAVSITATANLGRRGGKVIWSGGWDLRRIS